MVERQNDFLRNIRLFRDDMAESIKFEMATERFENATSFDSIALIMRFIFITLNIVFDGRPCSTYKCTLIV